VIGIDIVAISRIQNSMDKYGEKFLKRFLNDSELRLVKTPQNAAGLWAAKEAASKALGCGICEHLSFHDMTIIKDEMGAPYLLLNDNASAYFKTKKINVSITHDGGFCAAVALVIQH
jgi:holo-[acyl-carrier protein] synthase